MTEFFAYVNYVDFLTYSKKVDPMELVPTIELAELYLKDIGTSCIKSRYDMEHMIHDYTTYTYIPLGKGWGVRYHLTQESLTAALNSFEVKMEVGVSFKHC
jgi:hypothetical protein